MLAMKDKDGVIEASIPGLADMARITLEECEEGLTRLSSPDRYSRTKDHDGRRIQEIDGGWIVLNHEKYRGDTSTERVRKHREKKYSERDASIEQQGKCGCCGEILEQPYNLYVTWDHDHVTGSFRSYLCQSCNKLVGQVENGKTIISDKKRLVLEYVNRWSETLHGGMKRFEQQGTLETASDPDQIQIRSRSEDPKIKKKSRAGARSSSKSSPLEALSLAKKYLDIFNAVFDRRCGARSMVERKIADRLENGTPGWQILCAPILQSAIDPNTSNVRNFGPEMLLRDGSRRRQGENGATYGGTDWIERIYMTADRKHLDERLTAIAAHFELTEHIRRTGATLADTTR